MDNKSILRKIKIAGYKSFGSGNDALDLQLSDVNIIIGANGTGKSNVISFFKMLNNMMTGAFQVYIGKNGTAENLLHFGSRYTPAMQSSMEFKNDTDTDIYEICLSKAVQDSLIFSSESIIWNNSKYELASGQKESYLISDDANHAWEKIVKHILSNCRAFQFHDTSDTSHIRNASRIDNNRFLMSDGGNIAAYLYMLKNKSDEYKKYYNRIVERIRFAVPQFSDFVLEPQMLNEDYVKLQWKSVDGNEYCFGADQFSDGSIRFIALATLFLQPPEMLPNVIVIDEPELGLHPQAVDMLASMIKTASLHTQVIVATQSARLIDSFDPSQIIVAEYNRERKCSVFRRLDENKLADWLRDYSLSELWEKNVIGGQP